MHTTLLKTVASKQQVSAIAEKSQQSVRFAVLDGWRAVSILTVLACHMFPLGPDAWQLNEAAAPLGMSLFFTLSGFLITSNLWKNLCLPSFLIRRLARILPLAYLATIIYLTLQHKSLEYYVTHLLFSLNYRTEYGTPLTSPFWSLCVEIHFYLVITYLVGFYGRRGILALPLIGLAITAWRVHTGVYVGNATHERGDEILAGVTLALIYLDQLGPVGRTMRRWLATVPLAVFLVAFLVTCHPASGWLQYFRPYLGAAVVGHTLFATGKRFTLLTSQPMRYIAEISYALYVIHPLCRFGWFGSGTVVAKYLKRPLTLLLIFGLAHLSTFYYERHWIALGKLWSDRWSADYARGSRLGTTLASAPRPSLARPGSSVGDRISI